MLSSNFGLTVKHV